MSDTRQFPYHYHAYGLTIASELECPELLAAPLLGEAEVSVRLGTLSDRIESPRHLRKRFQIGDGVVQILVDDIAKFRVCDGRAIVVDPFPGAEPGDVRLFLLGLVFGTLLLQQRRLPIHASAVSVAGRVAAFCGPSGAGKSTLAAALHRHGYKLLCDDVGVAVPDADGTFRFYPGFPRIKLWRDVLDHFSIDHEGLERARSRKDKFQLQLYDTFHHGPLPLHAIYFLAQSKHEPRGSVIPLGGAEGVAFLTRSTYRPQLAHALDSVGSHLRQCAQLARSVRLYRYVRPWALEQLTEALDPLLATFSAMER